jgi:hypothetical protein
VFEKIKYIERILFQPKMLHIIHINLRKLIEKAILAKHFAIVVPEICRIKLLSTFVAIKMSNVSIRTRRPLASHLWRAANTVVLISHHFRHLPTVSNRH